MLYILQYLKGELNVSYGIINNIINDKINHYCNTEHGSSGSPILSLETFKIIGIHYGSLKNEKINYGAFIKYAINEFNNNYYKNEINLVYEGNNKEENIFGEKFVKNNKNNIELIINGIKNKLISKYNLKKGDNNIKMIIKNKIINLEYMFNECYTLKDLKALQNWDVSNGNIFECMFAGCSSLSDIKSLEKFNVSIKNNFDFLSK